jgi:tellurite resistance protein TerC
MASNWIFWLVFNLFIAAMLTLDLGVFNRRRRELRLREAIGWTALWIGLAAVFAVLILWFGQAMVGESTQSNAQLSLQFITGYVIEQSLSVDNLFVFLLIFRYFSVPRHLQHGVLFWGVIGALIMRAIFIFAGVALLNRFVWITYVFGAILVYSGIRLFRQHGAQVHPDSNPLLRGFRKVFPVTNDYCGGRFFVRRAAETYATPLALVLILLETTDVVFAVDSVPAVLAVTREPFIVYTSNVFAILGLRSLFFVLSGMIERFRFLHYGLSAILVFVGLKMIASHYIEMQTKTALGIVAGILLISVAASLVFKVKDADLTKA